MRLTLLVFVLGAMLSASMAQRPRTTEAPQTTPKPAPAPQTFKAKYEGGVFGYRNTMDGTLTFDDANNQLLFKDSKSTKEIHIPYDAVTQAFADTQKRQPKAATIAQNVPLIYAPNPAGFIKTKVQYLTLQYSDPDSKVTGTTSFKLENKELLSSVLATLAEKTGMTMRGDIYVKKRDADTTNP